MIALEEAWRDRESRHDLRFAKLIWMQSLAGGVKKKGGRDFTIADFMPSAGKTGRKSAKFRKAEKLVGEARIRAYFMRMVAKSSGAPEKP